MIPLWRLYRRDGGICWLCKEPTSRPLPLQQRRVSRDPRRPTRDHIVPKSQGGTDASDNIALACFRCNTLRGNHEPLRVVVARRRPA